MKKTLLPLILIATLLSNTAISYAQGNQPFWKINGNSNISSENFMGTINNQDLVIKTDNISRVIIQKNGLIMFKDKVIGEYPVRLKSKLTVDGTALFKDKVTFNGIGYFKNRLIVDDVTRLKNKLTVDSNAVIKGKIRNNYLSGSGIVLLKADNNGVIKKFLFPGDSTKVLRGDGTFSSFSAGITGSENNTVYFNTEGKQQESDALTNNGTDIKVKNGLTVGERSGVTGEASMVVGVSYPDYGLAAPEASNLATFAHGCNTKATGLAAFSTGVNTTASGGYSFSIGRNTIASGKASFAGGHDDVGENHYVVASGSCAFNFSTISDSYSGAGAAGEYSAILGGKDNSIDTACINSGIFCGRNNTISGSHSLLYSPPMQTVIIGGENITATEPNTVYVPNLIAMGSITANLINVGGKLKTNRLYADTLGANRMESKEMQVDSVFKVANSIIIDGINDRITSTSGYINFDNINLKEINKITADTINIGNIQVTGQSIFDSLLVKNNLTVGERSGTTGAYSMVVGGSGYGLEAPEASNAGAFAQGCNTKATGLASFSTGVSTKATGMASFSTGINTIASGESSFAGGHDDAGGNRFVVASGKGAFNYSAIGSGYIRVGAAAKNSAILGGKDHSIDTLAENSGIFCGRNNTIFVSPTQAPPMQTVIIGGENITATEPNTVYVPDLIAKGSITAENMNVTGQTVFDSLLVQKKITIGTNSMYLGTNSLGVDNNLWTDIGDMYIQSETGNDLNTIINANNKGFVGIGTNNPQQKLHIYKPSLPVKPDPIGLRIEKEDCGYWDMLVDTGSLFFTNIPLDPFIHSQLSLTKHGNVGIGTNNPQQKLHVNGNILIKGENSSLLFGDGETGTWGNWGIEYQDQGLNFWKPSGSSGGFANYILFLSDDGNVGVGTKNPHPDSRFNVVNYEDSKHRYAGYFISDFVSDEPIYGIFGLAMGSSHSNVGVIGKALTPCLLNYGVVGEAWNATERNYGGFFSATTSTSSLGGNFAITGVAINAKGHECTGLSSSARDARTNYGVKTSASGGLYAYGIYAGVGYASIEEWAGYFSGNVHATGDITWNSDIMMKKNIQNIENSLNIISQLNPKNFNFKVSDFPSMNLPNGLHYGLIAQQVDSVLPEIVCDVTHPAKYDSLGNIIYDKIEYKGINYISLIPILVQGIKQQQDTIKKLKDIVESYGKRFEHIDSVLVQCCSSNKSLLINNSDTNNNEINETEINSGNSILYQNRPNPFSKKTEINYYLSENVTQSSILVFNMQGILIKSYNLKTLKGNDKIVINGGELIPGIYIYALIVNNKEIDTKRMILTD